MLAKLSLRNAKRSMKDYSIYILTITIIFALLYSFQLLAFSKEIQALADSMQVFQKVMVMVSCIIVFVVAWLVNYMNRFMLEKRGRELGTYMLLGISNRSITHLVLIENMIIGSIAWGFGVIFGTFLYQIFLQVIMKLFEGPYEIEFVISGKALALTALYALLSYVFSMFQMRRKLKRIRICDLMYLKNKNDTKSKNFANHWMVGILAVIFCIVGGVLIYLSCHYLDSLKRACAGFICFIISIYLFYISLSSMLVKANIQNQKRKYTKDHLFLMRNLSSKMRSMKMTLGTLALLLMIALSAFQCGMFLQTIYDVASETACPFAVLIMVNNESYDFTNYETFLKENAGLKAGYQYSVYLTEDDSFSNVLDQENLSQDGIAVIRNSDYQRLRKLKGYEPIELQEDHYLIHGYQQVCSLLSEKSIPNLNLDDHSLKLQQINHEPLPLQLENFYCIVPDELIHDLPLEMNYYAALTDKELTKEQCAQMHAMEGRGKDAPFIRIKSEHTTVNNVQLVTFTFSLFFIGFIFVCIVATVLAVQQLNEAAQYQYRYRILSNLGVEANQIHHLILKQMLYYFGMPLILPVAISAWITFCVQQAYRMYIASSYLAAVIGRTLGLFLFVYALYFIATYLGYIKSINKYKVREE